MVVQKIKAIRLQREQVFSWTLWFSVIFFIGLYFYFTAVSVVQIVLREELIVEIENTESKISELEALYFSRSNELTLESAQAHGLVALSKQTYIHKSGDGTLLTRSD